jgi:ATP-dependent helicase HepA
MAAGILARVPEDLEELTQEVILGACESLGLRSEAQRGRNTWSIEFGAEALVDSLPGVPAGSSFLGTFDREEGVEKETIDFFASGHPLVEGILTELAEGRRGQVALLEMDAAAGEEPGFGLVALYREGAGLEAAVIDAEGRERPEWARRVTRRPVRTRRVVARSWTERPEWSEAIRRLGSRLRRSDPPLAVLACRFLPRRQE